MWKLASSNFERWKGNFELEKGNFERWKGHFILVSALSKSTASWNRCLLYSSLVETILKQMQHTILNDEDDHGDHDHDSDDIMMLNGRFNQALNYFASNKSHFERNLIRLSLPLAFPLSASDNVPSFWQCSQADKRKATLPFAKDIKHSFTVTREVLILAWHYCSQPFCAVGFYCKEPFSIFLLHRTLNTGKLLKMPEIIENWIWLNSIVMYPPVGTLLLLGCINPLNTSGSLFCEIQLLLYHSCLNEKFRMKAPQWKTLLTLFCTK